MIKIVKRPKQAWESRRCAHVKAQMTECARIVRRVCARTRPLKSISSLCTARTGEGAALALVCFTEHTATVIFSPQGAFSDRVGRKIVARCWGSGFPAQHY
ncbi:hypothetical protein BDN70DRAFT_192076 [Pholiota conissans]|uniref:Uncharacterized protein n=1 Tax=Pholiota conissans TaxID=109636 RepID=A0A9P5YWZ3_9AGAR|nr:hypothetical protein BDN70DRAFT_192076 [Pholiota conissans]